MNVPGAVRRRRGRLAAPVCALLLWAAAAPAGAETIDAARAAFAEGRFLEAAEAGAALGTSEGWALAARSLAIYGFHLAPEDGKQALFVRAMEAGGRAVALDADSAEAHVQSAHAMGRYAQTIGSMEAFAEGFADRIREALDAALALEPDHVAAHLALAGWHAGIVVAAGAMGRIFYGATGEDALRHYERALALAPDSPIVRYDFAENLLALDDDYTERAQALLRGAIALGPQDAYGELVRKRAQALLTELEAAGN